MSPLHQPHPFNATTFNRRRLLAGLGGAAAAGAVLGRGGLASAARRPAGSRPRSGSLPELSQWYHEYGEAGVLEAVERYASEYPDATVSIEWLTGYESVVTPALLTDEGPDVFEFGNGPTIDMIQAGQVVPLDGILGDTESDFNERMIERLTYDGSLWAVPQAVDMHIVVYRKSLLEAAGLEPPQTLDDLIAAAAALTTGDVKGIFLGNDGGAGVLGGSLLWSAGTDYLTPDGFGGSSEAVAASFAKVAELYNSDSILLGAPTDWSDPGAFIQGLTAIQYTGLWTFAAINESEFGDDYGVLAWPAADASTGGGSLAIGAYSSCVSAGTADEEAAKAFVQWLWVDNVEAQVDFATAYGFHIPARNSLAAEASTLAEGPAADAVVLSQENGFTQTPILWSTAMSNAYSDASVAIIQQGADPAETLAGVQAVVAEELARIGVDPVPTGSDVPTSAGSAPSSAPATTSA